VNISPNLHLGAVGNKDELSRLRGQKVKGQGHDETKYSQMIVQKCIFPRKHSGL